MPLALKIISFCAYAIIAYTFLRSVIILVLWHRKRDLWETHEAEVRRKTISYQNPWEYIYSYAGKNYIGDRLHIVDGLFVYYPNEEIHHKLERCFLEKKKLTIYVNPKYPQESVVTKTIPSLQIVAHSVVFIACSVVALIMIDESILDRILP